MKEGNESKSDENAHLEKHTRPLSLTLTSGDGLRFRSGVRERRRRSGERLLRMGDLENINGKDSTVMKDAPGARPRRRAG
jgi:hypothetical protein